MLVWARGLCLGTTLGSILLPLRRIRRIITICNCKVMGKRLSRQNYSFKIGWFCHISLSLISHSSLFSNWSRHNHKGIGNWKRKYLWWYRLVNRWGLHNVEGKYLWKFRPGHALGAMLAFNWNSNQQTWHHRWEFIFEKQGLYKLRKYGLDFSHMAMSVSDKAFGLKLQKKFW